MPKRTRSPPSPMSVRESNEGGFCIGVRGLEEMMNAKKVKAAFGDVVRDNSGIALFLVLWVIALLCVIAGEFCYSMRTEVNITRNFKEETEAYYIAQAGISAAVMGLMENRDSSGVGEDDPDEIRWRINADIPGIPFAGGHFKVRIENESGKININEAGRPLLKIMVDGFDIDDRDKDIIVDSILDWRDRDHFHHLNGAEDAYYQSLPEPYDCKDGDFDSIEELMLVKGVTRELFYGGLKSMATIFGDKPESDKKKRKTGGKASARPLPKQNSGNGKINLNAASPAMLRSLPLMTEGAVYAIIEFRRENDFKSLSELAELAGTDVYTANSKNLTLKTSSFFTIVSEGGIGDGPVKSGIRAIVQISPEFKKRYRIVEWQDRVSIEH